jgi:hypothetical protein
MIGPMDKEGERRLPFGILASERQRAAACFFSLAGGDCSLARQQLFGALNDGDVDHFAVDRDRADAFRERFIVSRNNPPRVVDLGPTRAELLV